MAILKDLGVPVFRASGMPIIKPWSIHDNPMANDS